MEEINQNSPDIPRFNTEKFEPKDEIEIQQITNFVIKKNLPIEIVGNQTKLDIGKKMQCAKNFRYVKIFWHHRL